jgi:hypothetical protein
MKKIYTLPLLLLLFFITSCSKDFLKSYDDRVVGTWRITDVDRFPGGSTSHVSFRSGTLRFYDNGRLDYTDDANARYEGSWDIVRKSVGEETLRTLQITAVNFGTREVLSQYYDEMVFVGTDHFKATFYSGSRAYVTHFRR